MGVDYSSKLLLVPEHTNPFEVVEDYSQKEWGGDFYSAADDLGLTTASPWYDAGYDNCEIGVELPHPTYEDLLDQESRWWDELNKAKDLLDKVFGEGNHTLKALQDIT